MDVPVWAESKAKLGQPGRPDVCWYSSWCGDLMKDGATRPEVLSQVERVNDSHLLRSSAVLRSLLQFLAEAALQHPDRPPKEQEIAERVFGQSSGFDPRVDSRVRVQIKRLREHLSKYYQEVGSRDRIVLQILSGSYQLQFLYREQAEVLEDRRDEARPAGVARAGRIPKWAWLAAAILIGISIGWMFRGVAGTAAPDPDFKAFWRPFLEGDLPLLVIYGNPQFYDTGGVLRERDGTMEGAPVADSFTGFGEVMAVAELVRVFEGFGRRAAFRRSSAVSWEEAKGSSIVFLGAFGLAVKALPRAEKFAIGVVPSAPPGESRTRIWNLKPTPTEPPYFAVSSTPCCLATTQDYAVIIFSRGLSPNRAILVAAGITTLGTQAAVEFMCRPSDVRTLLARFPAGAKGQFPYFEAVLKVRISGGAPVHSEIVAVHVRHSDT